MRSSCDKTAVENIRNRKDFSATLRATLIARAKGDLLNFSGALYGSFVGRKSEVVNFSLPVFACEIPRPTVRKLIKGKTITYWAKDLQGMLVVGGEADDLAKIHKIGERSGTVAEKQTSFEYETKGARRRV